MNTPLYFAYGSNMLYERIARRLGKVERVKTLVIQGFKLTFNCGNFKCSYANIIKGRKKDFVEGVLYSLTDRQISELDTYEGCPFNYQKRYMTLEDGTIIFAYISTLKTFRSRKKPTIEYLSLILAGAKENNLTHTQQLIIDYYKNEVR